MSFEFINLDLTKKQFHKMPANAAKILASGLFEEASVIQTESIRQSPVDDGVLQNSSFVQKPVKRGTRISLEMGYGGLAKAYALIQHERRDFKHTSGKSHYLKDPVNAAAKGFPRRISSRLEKGLL